MNSNRFGADDHRQPRSFFCTDVGCSALTILRLGKGKALLWVEQAGKGGKRKLDD